MPMNETKKEETSKEVYSQLSKQILELEKKIDQYANTKIQTREIINLTKDTLEKNSLKHSLCYIIPIALITGAIIAICINIFIFYRTKIKQIEIINQKLNETILTETQLQDFNQKLDNFYKFIDQQTEKANSEIDLDSKGVSNPQK